VIDTGIQLNHPDLTPVLSGKNCVNQNVPPDADAGHGTHVAGTIAARDNSFGVVGVAPGASLYAVKVLDSTGHGTWSQVICGIDWVTANGPANGIRVANMSLGAAPALRSRHRMPTAAMATTMRCTPPSATRSRQGSRMSPRPATTAATPRVSCPRRMTR